MAARPELHQHPIPGVFDTRGVKTHTPPGQCLLGYEMHEKVVNDRELTQTGCLSVVVLALMCPLCCWVPCVMDDCKEPREQRYQVAVYGPAPAAPQPSNAVAVGYPATS